MAIPDGFAAGAASVGVELTAKQLEQLERFVAELVRWNDKFNLLSRRDVGRVWTRHVLDSLSVLPLLRQALTEVPSADGDTRPRVLDLGTGAGFPGLPLAIAAPHVEFVLLDRTARKLRFLDLVVAGLGLANVVTVCADAARWRPGAGFQALVSRAVARPGQLRQEAGHLLCPGGVMLLMSGTGVAAEPRADEDLELPLATAHRLAIPGLDRAHEVTIIRD